jgi:tRNA(fMet)-specific endonuclease VapC
MTPDEVLLDTNIVAAFLDGEPQLVERVLELPVVLVSTVVLGELHYGARISARVAENLARINAFISSVGILFPNEDTSVWYGIVKQRLRAKGKMIPDNDIWIAAAALQTGVTLVSRDSHFSGVDNLSVILW